MKNNNGGILGSMEALEIVESARQDAWEHPSFGLGLYHGKVVSSLIFPFSAQSEADKKIGDTFLAELETFLKTSLDADQVDKTGELPASVIQGLAQMGCFGMKIPKEYGGLGFSQTNYNRAIELIASHCGSTAVWLSAHQSIGVPQPLKMFGTEEQKKKYLPRFSKGAISAFALTEPDVGSDPANMATTATPVEGGAFYLITGKKLWCTNGPVADVLVVMARTPDVVVRGKSRKRITAFIVEKGMPGFDVEHRCDFMGLKGIQNGLLRFKNVRVPKENIILGEGKGLKLALATLNTGRLTLPAGSLGGSKRCLQIAKKWSRTRVQWGQPVGQHEAVASKLGWMSAHLFAMESITWLASAWADKGGQDIRIEAAMAKLFCTEGAWKIVDETLQIRGGRGYETGPSLAARGEPNWPVERMFRDARINLIIEGTSEIMRLFLAREAIDPHLQKVLAVLSPRNPLPVRMKSALKAGLSYAVWYPALWIPRLPMGAPAGLPGPLRRHWYYIARTSRRLARTLFHQMILNQEKLQKRQMLLFRLVDVGVELFAMSAALSNAARLAADTKTANAAELADLFCEQARTRIKILFENLHLPEDADNWRVSQDLLKDQYLWLEEGIIGD